MIDILGYENFAVIEPIRKGMAGDKKYYIETQSGEKLLLRVAGISEYDCKKAEYNITKQVDTLGIPMSRPMDFGICEDGKSVYTLLSWIDGEEAETALPGLTQKNNMTSVLNRVKS